MCVYLYSWLMLTKCVISIDQSPESTHGISRFSVLNKELYQEHMARDRDILSKEK